MRHEQDATHLAAEVLQFLDHDLPALAVEAAETLVDDDRLDWPMLPAGVLADTQSEADGDAELLTAAEEGDVDWLLAGDAVVRFQFERFGRVAFAVGLAAQLQIELTAGQPVEHGVSVL